jgi:hypothetical protein
MGRIAWKWWAAFVVGLTGVALAYLSLPHDLDAHRLRAVLVVGAVLAGALVVVVVVRFGVLAWAAGAVVRRWRSVADLVLINPRVALATVLVLAGSGGVAVSGSVGLAAVVLAGALVVAVVVRFGVLARAVGAIVRCGGFVAALMLNYPRVALATVLVLAGSGGVGIWGPEGLAALGRTVHSWQADPAPQAGRSPSSAPTRGVPSSRPSARPSPSRRPTPSPSATPRRVAMAPVTLAVTHFCLCDGVRNQAQVKIKVAVNNRGTEPLDIAVRPFSPIRVVMASRGGRWTPPGTAASVGPMAVRLPSGQTGYAYPANSNLAFDYLGGGWGTFATHWAPTRLVGGRSYYDPGNRRGDLVYYLPTDAGNVLGVAYVDRSGAVLAFTPTVSWHTSADPNNF